MGWHMAQTLGLRTRRFHIGKLDFTRISAEAGAIAINGAALLLLLAPLSMHVPAIERPEIYIPIPVTPKQNPPPVKKPEKVEVIRPRVTPVTPAITPPKIEVQPPLVEPLLGDTVIGPQIAKVEPGMSDTIT